MNNKILYLLIGSVLSFAATYGITLSIHWGFTAGLIVFIIGFKYVRIQKKKENDEVEFDERVHDNLKTFSFQSFAFSQLLLLLYLLTSQMIFNIQDVQINYLILYLCATFFISFYIGPVFVKRR
jgi:magnesium-transporting ATPase (P-type)